MSTKISTAHRRPIPPSQILGVVVLGILVLLLLLHFTSKEPASPPAPLVQPATAPQPTPKPGTPIPTATPSPTPKAAPTIAADLQGSSSPSGRKLLLRPDR